MKLLSLGTCVPKRLLSTFRHLGSLQGATAKEGGGLYGRMLVTPPQARPIIPRNELKNAVKLFPTKNATITMRLSFVRYPRKSEAKNHENDLAVANWKMKRATKP